jgi:hypothetical protein
MKRKEKKRKEKKRREEKRRENFAHWPDLTLLYECDSIVFAKVTI